MNMTEYLASGKRLCACADVRLTISSFEIQNKRPWFRDPMRNLIATAINGPRYEKPVIKWQARCSQCYRLYLVADSSFALRLNIRAAGMKEAA